MHARHFLLGWQMLLESTEQIGLRYDHVEGLLKSRRCLGALCLRRKTIAAIGIDRVHGHAVSSWPCWR